MSAISMKSNVNGRGRDPIFSARKSPRVLLRKLAGVENFHRVYCKMGGMR